MHTTPVRKVVYYLALNKLDNPKQIDGEKTIKR